MRSTVIRNQCLFIQLTVDNAGKVKKEGTGGGGGRGDVERAVTEHVKEPDHIRYPRDIFLVVLLWEERV